MYRVKRKKKKTDYNVDFKKNLINVVNGIFIKKNLLSRRAANICKEFKKIINF